MSFLGLGPWELGLILVIVIIIFGVGRLPEVGGAIGKSIREFKVASAENQREEKKEKEQEKEAAGQTDKS